MARTATPAAIDLSSRAILVHLTIGAWSNTIHDAEVSREVAKTHGSAQHMGRYQKKLLPDEFLHPVNSAINAMRGEHRSRTLPWLDDGTRILGTDGYWDYIEAMRDCESFVWDALDAFALKYEPEFIPKAMQLLVDQGQGGLFKRGEYPSVEQIQNRYYVQLNYTPLPKAADFRTAGLVLDAETIAELEANARESERELLRTMTLDVVQRIEKVVGHMADRLGEYTGAQGQRLYESTVGNVRELTALLPSLNVMADPRIDAICKDMAERLCRYDVATYKDSPTLAQQTAQAADDILAKMAAFV